MRWTKETLLLEMERHFRMDHLHHVTNLRHLHVALVVKRGKLLGYATNRIGTRGRGCGYDHRSIHAERAVLKKIGDTAKLSGAILIVIRISRGTKEIVNSEPCHSCRCHLEKCMKHHGLKGVYYS